MAYHFNVVGTSVKTLRREFSNISLKNVLEINAPREVKYGHSLTLLTFAKRNEKKRKKSREIYSGGLTGGRRRRRKINGKQRKGVANVVADLAGTHSARARLPHPTKEVT